jgi:hypothetical protein
MPGAGRADNSFRTEAGAAPFGRSANIGSPLFSANPNFSKAPTSKLQTPEKIQIPTSKPASGARCFHHLTMHPSTTAAPQQALLIWRLELCVPGLRPDFSPFQSIVSHAKIRLVESAVVWKIASNVHRAPFALPTPLAQRSVASDRLRAARFAGDWLVGRLAVADEFASLGPVPLTSARLRNCAAFAQHRFHGLIHEHIRQMFGGSVQCGARLLESRQIP